MKISNVIQKAGAVSIFAMILLTSACNGRSSQGTTAELLNFKDFSNGTGKIAFAAQVNEDVMFDLYFVNVGTGKQYQVTQNLNADISPDFSKDGLRMVFSSNRRDTYDLFTINLPSGEPVLLLDNSANETEPRFSPDGTLIAFQSEAYGDNDIFVIASEGGAPVRLTEEDSQDTQPTWSPDGRQIAFVSDRGGNFEIYRMNADGTEVKPMMPHQSGRPMVRD
jgi:TolB protein